MVLTIIAAVALGFGLLILLARYAREPAVLRAEFELRAQAPAGQPAEKPEIEPGRLCIIIDELLASMGLQVREVEPRGSAGGVRLVAVGRGVLREAQHIIYLEASPPGGVVQAPTLLALVEDVAQNKATVGVLVTPGDIDCSGVAGVASDLELINGSALLALVGGYLPARSLEMNGYRTAVAKPPQPLG